MTPHLPGAQSRYGNPSDLWDRLASIVPTPNGASTLSMKYSDESHATKNINKQILGSGVLKRLVNVTNVLILVWFCAIWWGERLTFSNSLAACQWHQWEQWVSDTFQLRYITLTSFLQAARSKATSCCAYS